MIVVKNSALATASALAIILGISPALSAPGDWTTVGGGPTHEKYSYLTQITAQNVAGLVPAWTYPAGGAELTPIAVGGILFYPHDNSVLAVDGATGREVWETDLNALVRCRKGDLVNPARPMEVANRSPCDVAADGQSGFIKLGGSTKYGVAYWPGMGRTGPRIILATRSGYLIQLEAKTGRLVKNFGEDGALDLRVGVMEDINLSDYTPGAVPTIYKNLVIVAPRTGENGRYGTPGDPRAFDILTGKLIWRFHVIPRPGEENFGTWGLNGWQDRRGAGSWVPMTVDVKNHLVFMATGNATDQDYGATRPGANLYADTILALDADTGKLRWYYQTTHHDIYDWDANAPPVLIDMKDSSGKMVEAVASTSKQGYLFILDRLTGKPVLPVEEKPAVATDAPGELQSRTEPVPVNPDLTVARVGMSRSEVANISPESHKACLALYDRAIQAGEGTPYMLEPTLVFPSSTGGPHYQGATFDPNLNLIFVNNEDLGTIAMLTPVLSVNRFESLSKSKISFVDPQGYPCSGPPWGELMAIDAATGDTVWREPLGEYPELKAKGVPKTGQPTAGGSVATAGGVLFIGATPDKMFRAIDPKTGKLLWSAELSGGTTSTPLTYLGKDGKQYVAITAVGGRGGKEEFAAFRLP